MNSIKFGHNNNANTKREKRGCLNSAKSISESKYNLWFKYNLKLDILTVLLKFKNRFGNIRNIRKL